MGDRIITAEKIEQDANRRAAKGAKWLDVNVGESWAGDVNTALLDMTNGCTCVLGQVYADQAMPDETGYEYAMEFLGGPELFELGFLVADTFFDETWDTVEPLHNAWVREIRERTQ